MNRQRMQAASFNDRVTAAKANTAAARAAAIKAHGTSDFERLKRALSDAKFEETRLLNESDKQKMQAASPGAMNTFIPSHGSKKKYESQHSAKERRVLSPEEVQQIVDAMEQLDWVQYVKQQMMGGEEAPPEEAGMPPEEGGMPPEAMGEGPPGAEAGEGIGPEPPPAEGPPPEAEEEPPPPRERMAAGPSLHPPIAPPRSAAPGPGSLHPPRPPAPAPAKRYEASQGTVDEADRKGNSEGTVDSTPDKGAKKYKKEGEKVKPKRKELVTRIKALEKEVKAERYARTNAQRKERITELAGEGFAIDVDQVMELADAGAMDDQRFEKYAKVLASHAGRTMIGVDLPTHTLELADPAPSASVPGGPNGREQYHKANRDKAMKYCRLQAGKGKDTTGMYERTMFALSEGKPLPE
jgi:hypothetical protein